MATLIWVACGDPLTPTTDDDPGDADAVFAAPAVPLFTPPFAAADTFFVTNFFDHEFPNQFTDNNGFQRTWFNGTFTNIDGHNGYDWAMPTGTPLLAVAAGEVLVVAVDRPFFCPVLNRTVDDQLFVEIRHETPGGEVLTSVYVHVDFAAVTEGETVTQGQLVAYSGNRGCSTGPHLHFHVWRWTGTNDGTPTRIDPYGWYAQGKEDPWALHANGAASINLWMEPPPLCLDPVICFPNKYADLPTP